MKVLLIGEYSGFHRILKAGLEENGIESIVAGSPDGFKKIPVDINLYPEKLNNKYLYLIAKQFSIYNKIKNLKNYDIVQLINPFLFINRFQFYSFYYNKMIYDKLYKNNKNVFLSSCGNDALYVQIGKNLLDYNAIDPAKDVNSKNTLKETPQALKWNLDLVDKCKGVIPIGYEYWVGYNNFLKDIAKISDPIPPCIVTKEFEYEQLNIKGKIKIFHGVNKPKEKGSPIIIEAMKKMKEKYPNDIDLVIVEKLPYKEYVKTFADCHVNIDQVYSYAYGINALISMALGKITLSGAEPVAIKALKLDDCPVVNVKPDVNHICSQILFLLDKKSELTALGEKSRLFTEKYHDSKIVAKQYIDYWKSKVIW